MLSWKIELDLLFELSSYSKEPIFFFLVIVRLVSGNKFHLQLSENAIFNNSIFA